MKSCIALDNFATGEQLFTDLGLGNEGLHSVWRKFRLQSRFQRHSGMILKS